MYIFKFIHKVSNVVICWENNLARNVSLHFPLPQSPTGLQEADADRSSRSRRRCQEPPRCHRPIAAQDDGTLPPTLAHLS